LRHRYQSKLSEEHHGCSQEYTPRILTKIPLAYTAEDAQGRIMKMAYSENSEMNNIYKQLLRILAKEM